MTILLEYLLCDLGIIKETSNISAALTLNIFAKTGV